MFCQGYSAKEVGDLLGISRRTAEFHKYHIMDLLGCPTLADLIRMGLEG